MYMCILKYNFLVVLVCTFILSNLLIIDLFSILVVPSLGLNQEMYHTVQSPVGRPSWTEKAFWFVLYQDVARGLPQLLTWSCTINGVLGYVIFL